MTPRIPLVLLGAGWIVQKGYLPHLREGRFEVISVYDPDPDRSAAVMAGLPSASMAVSEEAAIRLPAAILIASPSPSHHGLALQALRAGRHVLCEKPVSVRASQVAELARGEGEGSGRLMGVTVCRYRPDIHQWLDWAAHLGRLRSLELTWVRSRGIPAPGSWHTSLSDGWTGVLPDLGCHLLDLAAALLGSPLGPVRCHSAKTTTSRQGTGASWYSESSRIPTSCEVNDRVEAVLEAGGVSIKLRVAWTDPEPGDVTELIAIGDGGRATFSGLLGFSDQRRVPWQQCQLWRGDRLIEERCYPSGVELQHQAFGHMLDEFGGVCEGAVPPIGIPQLLATATLMEAVTHGTSPP